MSLCFASEIEFAVAYFRASRMSFCKLRLEYALDGSTNYIAWKDHMEAVLEDNRLKDSSIKKSPSRLMLLNWRNGINVWLDQGESFWREFETT